MSAKKELSAFDRLPKQLRDILNYIPDCVDPRFILGMYNQQGLNPTIDYLDAIGFIPEDLMSERLYGQ